MMPGTSLSRLTTPRNIAALKIGIAFLSCFSSNNDFLGGVSLISDQTRYIDPQRFP
jgi:hypothetical protein